MRVKHVFKRGETAHAWVHEKVDHGRSASSRMSFDGNRFYSYNTVIAARVNYAGRRAYLLTTRRYSNTTNGHQAEVRHALPDTEIVLEVSGGNRGSSLIPWHTDKPTLKEIRAYAREEIAYSLNAAAHAFLKAKRARVERRRLWALEEANEWLTNARKIEGFFGLRGKLTTDLSGLVEKIAADQRALAKMAAERSRLAKIEAQETLDKWLAGEDVIYPYSLRKYGTRLRARDTFLGRFVETSLGIQIPYDEARVAFTWLMSHRAKGWRMNGEHFKIADYDVSSVSETGVVAGCHRVTWDEIERVAKLEGWL